MDWSKITSSGDLTEMILAQAAGTREDAYALLDLIQKLNEPFKIESKLVRFFVLIAAQSWAGRSFTVEIAFKDVEQGRVSRDCRIRLLVPIVCGSHELLKEATVKASYLAFRDAMRDRKKLAPFMLEDGFKGKYILIAERSTSLPPPEVKSSQQKLAALLTRPLIKPMTIPPALKKALEVGKRKPDPALASAGKQAEPVKPPPPARVPTLGSKARNKTRTYFEVPPSKPGRPTPIPETSEIDRNWDDEPLTLPKSLNPPKPRT